jgi:nicotinate-nucleotide--dimethylbenzimidazole phosphoribosyltransferase
MRVLVIGGIRSGKSELAEGLVDGVDRVRYLATAPAGESDEEWAGRVAAHRARRPEHWATEEIGDDPSRLGPLLLAAAEDDVILLDDLGGWLNATYQDRGGLSGLEVDGLAEAVRGCRAHRLVIVAPEVGLSVIPATEAGRAFADANGTLNQRIAKACDGVVLAVAGEALWLRGGPQFPPAPEKPFVADAAVAHTATTPTPGSGEPLSIEPGLDLPMPDDNAADDAVSRLLTLDFNGPGLGKFVSFVRFAAATQGRPDPRPWRNPRAFLLRGNHDGGMGAGASPAEADRIVSDAHSGTGTFAMLAAAAGASLQTVDCPASWPSEERDALEGSGVDGALTLGWRLAEVAVDEGADLIVLGSCGSGSEAASAAITAIVTGGEAAALLGRVVSANGFVDDAAWMRRLVAIRDTRHRIRERSRDPHSLLSMVGGGDIAVATGILLGATSRRTPVLIDGPVGVAAGLIARDYGAQTRHWMIMPDHGDHPTVKAAGDVLGTESLLSLKLGLGEGATALAALPLVNTALTLAAATQVRPEPQVEPEKPEPEDDDEQAAEANAMRALVDAETQLIPRITDDPE